MRVVEVDLQIAVPAVLLRIARHDVYDAADKAPVAHREIRRDEVESLEQERVEGRSAETEVEGLRNLHAEDERARFAGLRAADDQLPEVERRARHRREVEHCCERVAARARDAPDLLAVEGDARDLLARGCAAHCRLVARVGGAGNRVADLQDLVRLEGLVEAGGAVIRRGQGDGDLAGQRRRQADGEAPAELGVAAADDLAALVGDHDCDAFEQGPRAAFGDLADQALGRGRRRCVCRRRRRGWLLLHPELGLPGDSDGDRLAVGGAGGEAHLVGGLERGFVEAMAGRRQDLHRRDAALVVDDELEHDRRFEALGQRFGRIDGLDALEQLGRHQLLRSDGSRRQKAKR